MTFLRSGKSLIVNDVVMPDNPAAESVEGYIFVGNMQTTYDRARICPHSQPSMQTTNTPPCIFQFGVFQLDLKEGELRRAGVKIKLQDQPFRVLAVLLERAGQVITREELRQQVWPENVYIDFDQGLNNAIKKIREALGDSSDSPRLIETVARHGYRSLPR
jgi:DNA-binding response OmpR family regulator